MRATSYRRWTRARVIAAIKRWHRRNGEPPRQSDWDSAALRAYADAAILRAQAWRARAAEYESSDDWPPARHVADMFGSWNAAIEEAGFVPRAQGQRTRRGFDPSPRMAILGHVVSAVYDAEYAGDPETTRAALLWLAEIAGRLADDPDADELVEMEANVRFRESA